MAHIAINISEPYTFDKIMSASELMLYTNISNYLVDGVDMNTILSALAEFTDDATFNPVKINQENNMFQEWNGVNYVDTVKATGQNIEVEIGDNKVISSLEYGSGEWTMQDIQTDDGNVRGLEWKNIYPSVDRFYKDENEEWQPIDNDDYHENVKYVFHSLQPRGIKRIKIENGDFTDGNSIDLYKSFDSENQGDHLSVNLDSKKETFALYSKEFSINTIEDGGIYEDTVSSIVSSSPRCDSSALYNSGNYIFSNIVDSDSFLLAATDDEYVDYLDDAKYDGTFGGDYKGGTMSFTGLLNVDIKNIGIHKIENDKKIEGVINDINIFDNILCLNSRSSALLKDDYNSSATEIISKLGKSNLISNNLKLNWSDNTQNIVDVFIKNYSLNISNSPITIGTETIEKGIDHILTRANINNECVALYMGWNDPSKGLMDGMYFASIEISSDVDYALLYLRDYNGRNSGREILKLSYSNNGVSKQSIDILVWDVIEYSKTNGVASCVILNRHRPRFKNPMYKHINTGSVDTILSGDNKFVLYSRTGQTYIEEGEKKYSAYITIDENANSMLLYYGETNRPSLKVFYGSNGSEGEDVPTGGIVNNFEYVVVASSSQGYVNYNGRNYYNGDTFSGVGGNKNYDVYNGAKVKFRKKSVTLPQSMVLKYSKKQDGFGDTKWNVDVFDAHRLPSFISCNFELGIKSQDTELSYTVDSVNGSVTLVPTNINTFGRMREYSIPEYAVHSIEGGGRNYNPEVMAWLNSTDWYNGNPNYMTFEEAAAVDSKQFSGTNNTYKAAIITFDEARFFTSVTYLTPNAFYNCKLLERITLPNTLTEIRGFTWDGYGTFGGCTSLVSINIPDGVTTIGKCAFQGCSSLAIDYLPNTITSIGSNAFHGCSSLNLSSLPSNLTTIEYGTFGDCTSLALTSLPSGITSIGRNAFNGCRSLALTSLPNVLTTIEWQAFQNCLALKDSLYEIPASVTEIANQAFRYVEFPRLKFLSLIPPTFGIQSLYNPKGLDCQVPSASLAQYQEALQGLLYITISTY